MSTRRVTIPVKVRTDDGGRTGMALVSVFDNVDLQGDRVLPGAFKKSISKWRQSGDPLPVIWAHSWGDVFAHVGVVTAMEESDGGLLVTYQLDDDTPFVKQLAKLMKERRVKEWSFAYDVIKERRAKDGANELVELDLIEVGPCLKGANPETETLARKAYDATTRGLLQDAYALAAQEAERRARAEAKFLDTLKRHGIDTSPLTDHGPRGREGQAAHHPGRRVRRRAARRDPPREGARARAGPGGNRPHARRNDPRTQGGAGARGRAARRRGGRARSAGPGAPGGDPAGAGRRDAEPHPTGSDESFTVSFSDETTEPTVTVSFSDEDQS
jgi:HK97 family phage prohead protease